MPTPLYSGSPSRLLAWLDCPRRYRMQYLDRPRPQARPQRAHTSVGIATHNALRDFWDLPVGQRTPAGVAELVRSSWIDVGFRDPQQSAGWRLRVRDAVTEYLRSSDRDNQPVGIERSVSLKTDEVAITGRIDRLDARASLPLALYAVAASRMFRRPCHRVELHHVPSGTIAAHEHTDESLARKIAEAESIAADLRRADAEFRELGVESTRFAPRTSAICSWCDFRAHCPEGQQMGPEKSDWAGLEPAGYETTPPERDDA